MIAKMTKTGDSQNSPKGLTLAPIWKNYITKKGWNYDGSMHIVNLILFQFTLKKHIDILYMVHWLGLNSQAAQTFMYIHLFCINKSKTRSLELNRITTNFLLQNYQLFFWGSNMKVHHGSFFQMYDFLRPDNFTLKIDTLTPFERFQIFLAKTMAGWCRLFVFVGCQNGWVPEN